MFRPCIDLHDGRVKQIVGGSIDDSQPDSLRTNFVSEKSPAWFAELYRSDNLTGGHIIKLGQGNDEAAREALAAWPGGMQVGGGITVENAGKWIDAGASHVIVTSWLFRDGQLDEGRLGQLGQALGQAQLIIDLSCRKQDGEYFVVTDRWQTFTDLRVNADTLGKLAGHCDEFLIHGVDVEGLSQGIDEALVQLIAEHSPIPATYAGGAKSMEDLKRVTMVGKKRVHLTIGSALDIFGGSGVRYEDAVAFNQNSY
ncbi:MAG: phosphoribosylformimino-5-aminoimidazole carboxamide ribotide isomerase [Verrucomicrobiales bacterium]|nr:phosphoribosylformimino-5-aminoimidazole carboxamide ribotide isomerase [Verrucomicrobiales bacterium]